MHIIAPPPEVPEMKKYTKIITSFLALFLVLLVSCDQQQLAKNPQVMQKIGLNKISSTSYENLGKKHGITFLVSPEPNNFKANSATNYRVEGSISEEDLVNFYQRLAKEMNVYQAGMLNAMGVDTIVIVNQLLVEYITNDNQKAYQARFAVPVFTQNTLVIDLNNDQKLAPTFHHEIFHLADFKDDGKVYEDSEWLRLNPPDFRYGNIADGGKNMRDPTFANQIIDPAFVNAYSTTGIEEDKAEIYSLMIRSPAYARERARLNQYFAAKVSKMKEIMGRVHPGFTNEFWDGLGAK